MEFYHQSDSLDKLKQLAESDCHSILISGIRGSGKTYLASKFAKFVDAEIFNSIPAKVEDLRDAIDRSYTLPVKQVICIENLDDSRSAASQTILKYLEEPLPHVYVIVTCINTSELPSTILSRSIQLALNPPDAESLKAYGKSLNAPKFESIQPYAISACVKSYSEVKLLLSMTLDQIKYYEVFKDAKFWNQPSDTISWSLSHYPDNTKAPGKFVFGVIYKYSNDLSRKLAALEALLALENQNISESAVIGRFVINSFL